MAPSRVPFIRYLMYAYSTFDGNDSLRSFSEKLTESFFIAAERVSNKCVLKKTIYSYIRLSGLLDDFFFYED